MLGLWQTRKEEFSDDSDLSDGGRKAVLNPDTDDPFFCFHFLAK